MSEEIAANTAEIDIIRTDFPVTLTLRGKQRSYGVPENQFTRYAQYCTRRCARIRQILRIKGGKEFDLNADECDVCRYKLIVQGKKIAQTFDETQKEEVPIWLRIVAAFVPVIGIVIAAAYCIIAVEDKKMERGKKSTIG